MSVAAALKRACDGVNGRFAVTDGQLGFGRRAEKLEIAVVEVKQVRRAVDGPQGSVYIKFIAKERAREPPRGDNLEHITPENMLLHFFHQRFEVCVAHIRAFLPVK